MTLRLAARDRAARAEALAAVRSEQLIRIDRTRAPFLILTAANRHWAAVRRHNDLVITIAASELDPARGSPLSRSRTPPPASSDPSPQAPTSGRTRLSAERVLRTANNLTTQSHRLPPAALAPTGRSDAAATLPTRAASHRGSTTGRFTTKAAMATLATRASQVPNAEQTPPIPSQLLRFDPGGNRSMGCSMPSNGSARGPRRPGERSQARPSGPHGVSGLVWPSDVRSLDPLVPQGEFRSAKRGTPPPVKDDDFLKVSDARWVSHPVGSPG